MGWAEKDFDISQWDAPGRDKILKFYYGTGQDRILTVCPVHTGPEMSVSNIASNGSRTHVDFREREEKRST